MYHSLCYRLLAGILLQALRAGYSRGYKILQNNKTYCYSKVGLRRAVYKTVSTGIGLFHVWHKLSTLRALPQTTLLVAEMERTNDPRYPCLITSDDSSENYRTKMPCGHYISE